LIILVSTLLGILMAHHIFVMRTPDRKKLLDQLHQQIITDGPRPKHSQNGPIFLSRRLQLCYNPKARYLPIRKNIHLISAVEVAIYEKVKILRWFQCPSSISTAKRAFESETILVRLSARSYPNGWPQFVWKNRNRSP